MQSLRHLSFSIDSTMGIFLSCLLLQMIEAVLLSLSIAFQHANHVIIAVDLVPLYPEGFKPASLSRYQQWYIDNYHDKFFSDPPLWFTVFIWLEALYHIPLSIWAVRALLKGELLLVTFLSRYLFLCAALKSYFMLVCWLWIRLDSSHSLLTQAGETLLMLREGDPRLPLQLFIFALLVTFTTATCIIDMYSWKDVSWSTKKTLMGFYGPYLGLGKLSLSFLM